jgi:hypothetical protein
MHGGRLFSVACLLLATSQVATWVQAAPHPHGTLLAQAPGTASGSSSTPRGQAATASPPKTAATGSPSGAPAASAPVASKPSWGELTPQQQQTLQPLQANWATLSEPHKRKWVALTQNFSKLPAPEQAKLRARMVEWAALTPQQRAAARLNFATSQQLAPASGDKAAQWKAYQALSPEEKRKLAEKNPKPTGAATAVRPVPEGKIAKLPPLQKDSNIASPLGSALVAPGQPAQQKH